MYKIKPLDNKCFEVRLVISELTDEGWLIKESYFVKKICLISSAKYSWISTFVNWNFAKDTKKLLQFNQWYARKVKQKYMYINTLNIMQFILYVHKCLLVKMTNNGFEQRYGLSDRFKCLVYFSHFFSMSGKIDDESKNFFPK